MNTVGIGKIVVDNTYPEWNYPHFHVLVFQEESEDGYYAFCMELGIDAFSEYSAQVAFFNIAKNVLETIAEYKNKESLFKSLLSIANSDYHDVFWKEYRITETRLAECADDLGSGLIYDLKKEIEQLRKQLNQSHEPRITNMGFQSLNTRQVA